jgi:hypothetical protein
LKALDCENCIFFPHLARIEKNAVRKKGTAQVKKNPPSPQAGRGGAEIFKEFFSLV